MKIALCLIVKDEEKVIARCLESFKDLVDEIHITDTGSTDKTIEIAKEYGANVKNYKEQWAVWSDHETIEEIFDTKKLAQQHAKGKKKSKVKRAPLNYARARNFAQEDIKADAIFSVDADEYLHPKSKKDFKEKVEFNIKQSSTILIPIYTAFGKDYENPGHIHYLVRLFKTSCRWAGRIHEVISYEKKVISSDLILLHDKGVKRQAADKISNYIANLKFEAKREPLNPRPLFYLGNTYFENGRLKEAVKIFYKYLKITKWPAEKAQALINLGKCYRDLKKPTKAKHILTRAVASDPTRVEAWFYLGDVVNPVSWQEACAYYEIAAEFEGKEPPSMMFLEPNCYTWLPWYRLSIGYDKLGDHAKGVLATEKALKYIPENKDMIHNLKFHASQPTSSPENPVKVSSKPVNIIIPSATPEFAEKCINSILKAETNVLYMITLVRDGHKKFPEFDERVEVIQGTDPFVFARNINLGVMGTSDVVILNDDTEVEDYWLDNLQVASRDQSTGVVSPLVTDIGNVLQHVSSKEEGVFWKTEPDILCFVCVYIPLEIVRAVGDLDENYIWYGYEDNDYCLRTKNSGFDLKICHTVEIKHRRHSTFKETQSKLVNDAYVYHEKKWSTRSVKTIAPKIAYLDKETHNANLIPTSQPLIDYEGPQPKFVGQVVLNNFGKSGKIIFGKNCEVRHGTYFEVAEGTIKLEDNVVIGIGNMLQGNGDIFIGEGTIIGPHCNIYSTFHPDTSTPFFTAPLMKGKVTIGKNVFIGAGVTILHDVIVGDNSIIGAHSLVNADVPDGVVIYGTPARIHRRRNIPIERQTEEEIEQSHLERYSYVVRYLRHGDVVLDVGCGSGYGSKMLIDSKKCRVIGIDLSETAIARSQRIKRENLKIIKEDALQFNSGLYDKIIAFEIVEHVEQDKELVAHLLRLLKPDGELFLSVPSDKVPATVNPYHYRHYAMSEFLDLVPKQKEDESPRKIYPYTQVRGESVGDPYNEDADYFIARVQRTDVSKKRVLFTAGVENTDRPERWEFALNLFQDLAASFKELNIDCVTLCHPVLKNRSINTLAANEDVLIKVVEGYNPDFVFVWNGNSDGDKKVIEAVKKCRSNVVYAELGWFPQKGNLHFDLEGVNAASSLATQEFEPLTEEQQKELAAYKERFRKEKTVEFECKEEHILIALQDEKDSNIINSRFDSMYQFVEEALPFIRRNYPKAHHPNLKIKVRPHPHFKDVKLPESDDFEIDTDPIYKSIMEAREVHAINSTVLLEAALLEKKIITYAPGLTYAHSMHYLPEGKAESSPLHRLDALLYHLIKRQLKWEDLQNPSVLEGYEVFKEILK